MTVDVKWKGSEFEEQFSREIGDLVTSVAAILSGEVRKVLSRKKSPPPSKAGEVPHQRTGLLQASWHWSKAKKTGFTFRASTFTNRVYARALEFGYKPRNLAPRPYIGVSIRKAKPRIKRSINVNAMIERAVARLGEI